MTLIDEVVAKWHSEKVALRDSAPMAWIAALERVHKVVVPGDLRELLRRANGFQANCNDENGFRFFAIEEYPEFDEGQLVNCSSTTFPFADYLQWCWGYGIELGPIEHGSIWLIGTENSRPRRIASSFSRFLQLYLEDAPLLYKAGPVD
jgi:hypothetical protein